MLKRDFAEFGAHIQGSVTNVKKYVHFWDFEFFPSPNPEKPPFSLKLEVMRISPEKTATKNIKN